MPKLLSNTYQRYQKSYTDLQQLIEQRQQFEAQQADLIPASLRTDQSFPDLAGWTLLLYATGMGDLEKIKTLQQQGVSLSQPMDEVLSGNSKLTALQLALYFGHEDLAHYLLSVVPITDAIRSKIDLDSAKKLYDQAVSKNILNPIREKFAADSTFTIPFFPPTRVQDRWERSYLNFAAEIGDLEFLEIYFQQKLAKQKFNLALLSNKIENPLITAIQNKQLTVLKFLLNYIDPNLAPFSKADGLICDFFTSALHIAAAYNDWDSAVLLLASNANVNLQNTSGYTPLAVAIEDKDEEFAGKLLLNYSPDLSLTTNTGDTLLHLARNCSEEFRQFLTNQIKDKNLLTQPNIYDEGPDATIHLKPIDISEVERKIYYFLLTRYRDLEIFNKGGHCNGWNFIYRYYSSRGKGNFYYSFLRLIVDWDGTEKTLSQEVTGEIKKHFSSLNELFDVIINNLIWYLHHPNLGTSISQRQRGKQFDEPIEYFLKNYSVDLHDIKQLFEINHLLSRLPEHLQVESNCPRHIASFETSREGAQNYYDNNLASEKLLFPLSIHQLTRIQADNLYRAGYGRVENIKFSLDIFNFPWDLITPANFFCQDELPTSKEDAKNYVANSANKYTHLHVAVLTRSTDNFRQLIQDEYCDINAKDAHDMTMLDILFHTEHVELLEILLNNPKLFQALCFFREELEKQLLRIESINNQQFLHLVLKLSYLKLNLHVVLELINRNKHLLILQNITHEQLVGKIVSLEFLRMGLQYLDSHCQFILLDKLGKDYINHLLQQYLQVMDSWENQKEFIRFLQSIHPDNYPMLMNSIEDNVLANILMHYLNIKNILEEIPGENRLSLLQAMGLNKIKAYLKLDRLPWCVLTNILDTLPKASQFSFLTLLGQEYLKEILSGYYYFKNVLDCLSIDHHIAFVDFIGTQHFQYRFQNIGIADALREIENYSNYKIHYLILLRVFKTKLTQPQESIKSFAGSFFGLARIQENDINEIEAAIIHEDVNNNASLFTEIYRKHCTTIYKDDLGKMLVAWKRHQSLKM